MSQSHDHSRQGTNMDKEDNNRREQQEGERPSSKQSQNDEQNNTTVSREASQAGSPEPDHKKNYDDVTFEPVDPENFDTKSFFSSVDALSHKLHSDSFRSFDNDFDGQELSSMVSAVTVSMENFKNYTMHSQAHLEKLREQIKDVKDRMHRKVLQHPYDSSDQRMSYEERELEAKLQQLHKELARTSEELVRAEQISAETEISATKAANAAEHAAEEAKLIQKEYEARKKAEAENRKKEEERKAREEKEQEERAREEEEMRKAEEARKAKLRKEHVAAPDWENWPTFVYRINQGEFDQGIGCIVRGNPDHFRENMISCEVGDLLDSGFTCEDNEELVSNIINIKGDSHFDNQAYILIPHCTSRASAMNREPVIKAETDQGWIELHSQDVALDGHKDIKFVQAELKSCSRLAVVTRFKNDFLVFTKRGGTMHSNVDSRASFTATKGCFKTKEPFVVQMQPVDSGTIHEVRVRSETGKDLLATSAFMCIKWTSTEFGTPITFDIPVPPNPVKAKKAAAARAVKEAKMKNPHPHMPPPDDEDEIRRKKERQRKNTRRTTGQVTADEEETSVTKKPTKWYMGQYGAQDEDDNDILYFTYKDTRGKWHVVENKIITQVRLDMVELDMVDPHLVDKFMVLRMKTSAEACSALQLVKVLEARLTERTVNVVLKQNKENPYDVIIDIVQHSKVDKTLEKLEKDGYSEGPDVSKNITLREGDRIGIGFRANVQCSDKNAELDLLFNSQLHNRKSFELVEVDKYLQKSYPMYRGYVQVLRKVPLMCLASPRKEKKKAGKKEEQEEKVDEEKEEEDVAPQTKIEYEKEVLCEIQVNIPKEQDQLEPVAINKAKITLRNRDDVVNDDTLHAMACELGDDWKRVASYLNVRKTRLQAIMRNNMAHDKTEEDAKYDMLITWAKGVPKSMNKVEMLKAALKYAKREDLANKLTAQEDDFQRQRKGLDHAET